MSGKEKLVERAFDAVRYGTMAIIGAKAAHDLTKRIDFAIMGASFATVITLLMPDQETDSMRKPSRPLTDKIIFYFEKKIRRGYRALNYKIAENFPQLPAF